MQSITLSKPDEEKKSIVEYKKFSEISFSEINNIANDLADKIENKKEELINILLEYESYEVATDEIDRTLDLLRNLEENEKYFKMRIGAITSFLPRNQPLYALSCFVLVPSLMAEEVCFRIPAGMRDFFPKILNLLEINNLFPNVYVSKKERLDFLLERSALYTDDKKEETHPITDAVIFTGNSLHADQLRMVFDNRTLFITNGSGHNPVVVGKGADINEAAEAVLTLTLYNQGQDCAAPNSILVCEEEYEKFLDLLINKLNKVKVGKYTDRECRIGPISKPRDLIRIKEFLVDNRDFVCSKTPGVFNVFESIIEPVVITKPLKDGGNYDEIFAPVIFVQKYEKDDELREYFENKRYLQNAMYLTLYGENDYVNKIKEVTVEGKKIHNKHSFIKNKHLHAKGVERGTQPYGGLGLGASSVSLDGKIISKATLPQRDIYEFLVEPYVKSNKKLINYKKIFSNLKEIVEKDVKKLLKIKSENIKDNKKQDLNKVLYIDKDNFEKSNNRYLEINKDSVYQLLDTPNDDFISGISIKDIENIRKLRVLIKRGDLNKDEFKIKLYDIVKDKEKSKRENIKNQRTFFKNVYQILFGIDHGPRLDSFLLEIRDEKILELLDL